MNQQVAQLWKQITENFSKINNSSRNNDSIDKEKKSNDSIKSSSSDSDPSDRWYGGLLETIKSHVPLIVALNLSILYVLFFLVITTPEVFESLEFYRTRWFALGIIALGFVTTYFGSFWNKNATSRIHSYIIFVHSIIITLFSFGYLIRLNNGGIQIFDVNIATSIIFIPIAVLVFVVNYNLFSNSSHAQLVTVSQALLIILFSYSIGGFLEIDSTAARTFNQGWLSVVFDWPAWFWVAIASTTVWFVSLRNIVQAFPDRKIIYYIAYLVVTVQLLLAVYLINFTYWYQTLLALIAWNFVYTNFYSLMTKKNDLKYRPRLTISVVYHIVLFILVLYVGQ